MVGRILMLRGSAGDRAGGCPGIFTCGISGLMVVLTNRLAHNRQGTGVTRGRSESGHGQRKERSKSELKAAYARGRVVNFAILMATLSALMVCLVIITLFMGSFQSAEMSVVISGMFVVCMLFLALAFCAFLAEVLISTGYLKAGMMAASGFGPESDDNNSSEK